jgi:hypothetical protein
LVPIITDLSLIKPVVAATLKATQSIAAVTGLDVAVIAALFSDEADPVTTACFITLTGTGVGIDRVTIIAGFAFIDSTVAAHFS